MLTPGSAAIVFHPAAGQGRTPELARQCARHLVRSGWRVTACVPTRYAGHAENVLVPGLADGADLLVVVAGDGTLREVCAGLVRSGRRVPVGLVPAGNANVLAREFGIPLAAGHAIRTLTTCRLRCLDLGLYRASGAAQWRPFLAMVEVGPTAEVVRRVDRLRRGPGRRLYRRLGDAVYALAGLPNLWSPGRPSFRFRADRAGPFGPAAAAVFANTATYAKGWSLVPAALPDDGRISYAWWPRRGLAAEVRIWRAARRRRPLGADGCRYGAARCVEVSAAGLLHVQMDGDPLPATAGFEIKVEAGAVGLLVPSTPRPPENPPGPGGSGSFTAKPPGSKPAAGRSAL
jgi:diacylglycerol kinase family enzyme